MAGCYAVSLFLVALVVVLLVVVLLLVMVMVVVVVFVRYCCCCLYSFRHLSAIREHIRALLPWYPLRRDCMDNTQE